MPNIPDHPLRYALVNELHARPFPTATSPGRALFLALKQSENAAGRDRSQDLEHLIKLLQHYGAPLPEPDATHYFGTIGQNTIKWEQHSEFTTYTILKPGATDKPFDPAEFDIFPTRWVEGLPGARMTSAIVTIENRPSDEEIQKRLQSWFVAESLAVSQVLGNAAVVGTDFRTDGAGHLRFALFVNEKTGARRVGRIVQRLMEIETYKTMSMLGFSRARQISSELGEIHSELTELMDQMAAHTTESETTLDGLLKTSAHLEHISAQTSYRFGATAAYEAIVHQRIEVLREERFLGRQTFAEFMMRRYDPAMRTVKSTEGRLAAMADRAIRAGDLLRTRVDVERSKENQALLASMDERAQLQLRLQETVEGLSVVAISYYAVSLASYALYPVASHLDISKGNLTAMVTIPVVALVWWMVRRIRNKLH